MNQLLVICLAIAGYALLPSAEAPASDTSRWGITTKKKIEDKKDPAAPVENGGTETARGPSGHQPPPPVGSTSSSSPADMAPQNSSSGTATADPMQEDAGKPQAPPNSTEPSKATTKKPSATGAADGKLASPETTWASEQQKTVCEAYLKDLQEHFLKARHFSIQGVPCNTAEHASAFLRLSGKCRKDCPQGLLEQRGYTQSIIRNITTLEKLGRDRCR
jgi:hypothetical protein